MASDDSAVTHLSVIRNSLAGVVFADDAAWINDTSWHLLVGGLYQSTPQTVTDGRVAPFQIDVNGNLKVAAHSVTTIATSVTPGTSASHLGKAEDAAHSSGDTGVFILAVRADTAAQTAGTDGDYCGLICDASGRLHVNVGNVVAASQSGTWNVGAITTSVTPGTGAANLGKAEDAAHSTGDTGVFVLSVRADSRLRRQGRTATMPRSSPMRVVGCGWPPSSPAPGPKPIPRPSRQACLWWTTGTNRTAARST